tara:strand:- start:1114 stop:2886 length:1773 start_codon:yes stop_codon:yes gene_type:complete
MKILKLLNKYIFSIILALFFILAVYAEEQPVDIWNIDKKSKENLSNSSQNIDQQDSDIKTLSESDIYKMQSQKTNNSIELEENLKTKEVKLFGLYDPEDNSLDINMWSKSDGDQLKRIFSKLAKIELSQDAKEIMKISLLTNAYSPKKNISEKEFLKFKSNWLIKNSDLELIEEYLIKNQIVNFHPELTRFLVDEFLSEANLKKACEIFSKNLDPLEDKYLVKFNIYCLVVNEKIEEAQLLYDLKKELGFKDEYFDKKISFLLGYNDKIDITISEKSILDFHLAHRTNSDFIFEPNENTDKIIWKYLSASNLITSIKKIEPSEFDKISILEKATHDKNYPEEDLFKIYRKFQFNINQLLNAEQSYKSLSKIEARALVYQRILLESEMIERLKLLKLLKNLFKKEKIENAFDVELKKFLEKINPTDIPDNLTSFYYTNINIIEDKKVNVDFNNDVLHQSKLINYLNGDYSKSKIEKDLDNFLRKIKKNKKYFFSKKDQIFLESLKFDGIEISKKYEDLTQFDETAIPTDIQVMINNNEKGAALLRIVEVIGQDKLDRIDEDTIYFIIRTLNQLDIELLRNKILLKVLPLKV